MRSTLPVWTSLVVFLAACGGSEAITPTVAQIERVRAGVTLTEPSHGAANVEGVVRLVPGAVAATDDVGRALLVLDHGERLLLDHGTRVRVTASGSFELDAGRVWVSAAPVADALAGDACLAKVGSATLRLRGVRASVEWRGDGATVDVVDGEAAWAAGPRQGAVRAGEHAVFRGAEVNVTPRTLLDDWTGGLADDQPAGVTVGGVVGLGAVAARRPDESGAPRWPLVLQRVDARVAIVGDLAVTELEQTFFNPAADTVEGIYSVTVPRGAVLQRFAVDRRGVLVDGFVREKTAAARDYQAQVYVGSTHDPALLEWDAPGSYHARLYPITPGLTRKVLVTYTQWLTPRADGGRTWRLPLAGLGTRVGELRADVDISRAGATEVRASEGARRDDTHVTFTRSDTVPTADFVLDLRGAPVREAAGVRVAGRTTGASEDRNGFLRVAVQAPFEEARTARDEGLDLVVIVDHSAATDPVSLQLGSAFAEALARSLHGRDRLLVLAGDVGARPVGVDAPRMQAVTPAARQELLDALARDRRGGATDLGAMIEAANSALDPQRNSAVVYIGDGQATVGERDLPALRARLARMNPHPRLYAIAVGEAPRLDLLAGVAEPAGFAARVARRADVARTALDLITHASRPLVRNFSVDLGAGVERVYPTEAVDVPAGEALVAIGRYLRDPPGRVKVRAMWNGREARRELPLSTTVLSDHGDLQYRWATARLDHLLAAGESRAVIVELGTRFGLVTPFTSLYVPSEDEPLPPRNDRRTSDARDLSVFDFIPLVGCGRSGALEPATSASPTAVSAPAPQGMSAGEQNQPSPNEGRMGRRTVQSNARYATRNADQPTEAAEEAAPVVALPNPTVAPLPTVTQGVAAVTGATSTTTPVLEAPVAAPAAPPEAVGMPRAPAGPGGGAGAFGDLVGGSHMPTARAHSARRPMGAFRSIERERTIEDARDRGVLDALAQRQQQPATAVCNPATDNCDGVVDTSVTDADGDEAQNRMGWAGRANNHEVQLAARSRDHAEATRAAARVLSRCSDAAAVTLAERVALWRERIGAAPGAPGALRVWAEARRACELPGWPDRVALLRLIVGRVGDVDGQLALYHGFRNDAGARGWVRDTLLRTLARTGELGRASSLGLSRLDAATLTAALAHATTPQERLNVLRLLARRFPDDIELTLLMLDAASAASDRAEVRRTATRLRDDPRTDARVRTAVGEALLAIGDEADARRTFSEIVEFAPDDPWARRRLGDIALAHGWADEAYRQYQTLAAQLNEAPEILLRLAWAARAAGRLDEALRLAERVTSQTAPGAAGTVSEAAAAWIAAELAIAGTESNVAPDTLAALRARWRRSPAARSAGAVRVLLRWQHPDDEGELWVGAASEPLHRADLVASLVPLETSVWAEAPEALQVELRRGGGGRPRGDAEVIVIWNEGTARERVARQRVHFDPDHLRFTFDATDGSLTERPAPAAGGAR